MDSGVGVTHFSIMLASYLATFTRKKVKIVTIGSGYEYGRLNDVYNGEDSVNEKWDRLEFCIGNIEFLIVRNADQFCDNIISEMCRVKDKHIIYDIGNNLTVRKTLGNYGVLESKLEMMKKFSICDYRFMITNVTAWKQKAFESFYDKYVRDSYQSEWKCLYTFGDDENAKFISKEYKMKMVRIPICHDPFFMTADIINDMKNVLEE